MKTWLLFIDGMGIGSLTDPDNPFRMKTDSFLTRLIYGPVPAGWYSFPVDATLGVSGLPQSGTGQMAILTGKNSAEILGKHHGPFPHTSQRSWLVTDSIVTDCKRLNKTWDLFNVYPDAYFNALEARRLRLSTFGFLQTMNGKALHPMGELESGTGFPPVLDYRLLSRFGYQFPVSFPDGAVTGLIRQFDSVDLGITEFFEMDHAGHERNPEKIFNALDRLSTFLEHLSMAPDAPAVVIVSDHGNCENLSTGGHTENPVPLIMNFLPSFVPSSITDSRVLLNEALLK